MFLAFLCSFALCVTLYTRFADAQAINARASSFRVTDFLIGQNADLTEFYRNLKFQKMQLSPFIFYRGANPLYYRDMGLCARCWGFAS